MILPYVSSMLRIPSESLGREGTDDRTSTSNQFDMHNPDMLVMATEVLVFMAVEGNLSSRMLVRTAPVVTTRRLSFTGKRKSVLKALLPLLGSNNIQSLVVALHT